MGNEHEHIGWNRPGRRQRCILCGHRFGPGTYQSRRKPWLVPLELLERLQATRDWY
jgi:hypothetical protein